MITVQDYLNNYPFTKIIYTQSQSPHDLIKSGAATVGDIIIGRNKNLESDYSPYGYLHF